MSFWMTDDVADYCDYSASVKRPESWEIQDDWRVQQPAPDARWIKNPPFKSARDSAEIFASAGACGEVTIYLHVFGSFIAVGAEEWKLPRPIPGVKPNKRALPTRALQVPAGGVRVEYDADRGYLMARRDAVLEVRDRAMDLVAKYY